MEFLRLTTANHILATSLFWGAPLVPTLLHQRWFVVPLSSGLFGLELPPLQLPGSALLIYRKCIHSGLRRTRDSFLQGQVFFCCTARAGQVQVLPPLWIQIRGRCRFEYRIEALVSAMHNVEHSSVRARCAALSMHDSVRSARWLSFCTKATESLWRGLMLASKQPQSLHRSYYISLARHSMNLQTAPRMHLWNMKIRCICAFLNR